MLPFIFVVLGASLTFCNPVLRAEDRTPSRCLSDPSRTQQAKKSCLVDDDTYQKLVFYAGYPVITGALANGTCSNPSNGAELVQYFNINSTDTQAALWKSASTREYIIGIPGTAGLQDIFTDLELALVVYDSPDVCCIGSCKVHAGFLNAWNSLAPAVIEGLTIALNANPGYTTVISGHSLGAGIAALAFASLKGGPFSVTGLFTYGQPRTGNQEFADYLDRISGASDSAAGSLYRVTHFNGSSDSYHQSI